MKYLAVLLAVLTVLCCAPSFAETKIVRSGDSSSSTPLPSSGSHVRRPLAGGGTSTSTPSMNDKMQQMQARAAINRCISACKQQGMLRRNYCSRVVKSEAELNTCVQQVYADASACVNNCMGQH